jgi:flagellar assembly factor FliW
VTVLDAPAPALPVVGLTESLPGFPGYRDYALVAADRQGLVFWLQSVDPAGPRFLAVPAAEFFPAYEPALPRGLRRELELADGAEAVLYCIVTVPDGDVTRATANLRAPLAVNPTTGHARQVVLSEGDHPIRQPLRR